MDDEEVAESEVQFCIKCRSQELRKTDEALTCKVAECSFQLRRVGDDKDARGRLLVAAKELGMKFCYVCGEELQQEEELLMCSGDNGCGMKFVVPIQPIPKPAKEESQDVKISEDDVNYCIVCEKGELTKTRKVLMCKGKRCKFKLQRGDDKDVLTKLQTASKELGMNYCYACGEKLEEVDDVLMCSGKEGCGMKFPLVHSIPSRPDPQHVDLKSVSTEVRSPTAILRKSPESGKHEGIVQPPNDDESRGMQGSRKVVSDPEGRTLSAGTSKHSTAAADVGDSTPRRDDSLALVSDSTTEQSFSDPIGVQKLERNQSAKTEGKWTDKPPALPPPSTNAATKPLPSERSGKNTFAVAGESTNTENPEADFLGTMDKIPQCGNIAAASKNETSDLSEAIHGVRPLTPSEERFVILAQRYPDTGAFHECCGFEIEGELSIPVLQQSIRHVCKCHEALRSCVTLQSNSNMLQVLPHVEITMPEDNEIGITDENLKKKAMIEVQVPFNMYQAPLFRLRLFKVQERKWLLVVTMHHIICDGDPSFTIFAKQVRDSYEAILKGKSSELPAQVPKLRPETNMDLTFWTEKLEGVTGMVNLPWQQNPLKNLTFEADHVTQVIPPEVTKELMGLLQKVHVEQLQVLLLSVFHILLHKYSGQTDVCVGYPIDNRSEQNMNMEAIGYFGNPLAIRTKFSSELTCLELLKKVSEFLNTAIQHNCPFQEVVKAINPKRHKNARMPFFNTLFVFGNVPASIESETITFHPTHIDLGLVPYDVILTVRLATDYSLLCHLEYNSVILHHRVMGAFLHHFASLCKSVTQDPNSPIMSLPMLQEQETFEQIKTLNLEAYSEYPRDKLVHEIFKDMVTKCPQSIALHETCEAGITLTYQELNVASDNIALTFLKDVKLNDSVALLMERSALTVASILGILKAGCCYVQLDPYSTPQRIKQCVLQCNATHVFCSRKHEAKITSFDLDFNIKVHIIDNLFLSPIPETEQSTTFLASTKCDPSHVVACTMVTSGTTSQPKAVDVPHKAIVRIVCGSNYIQFTSSDVSLLHSPLNFDASTFELWSVLLNGGRLAISTEEKLSPAELAKQVYNNEVTMVWLTSGLFNVVMDFHSDMFRKVNHILTGGDVVCVDNVQRAQRQLPLCSFYNMYGPTEGTTFTSYYKVPENFLKASVAQVPIGKPVSNTKMYILDDNLMPVPIGMNGTLYIGGDGIAKGYRNAPNHKAFISPPSHILSAFPEECRLYNSGDMVRALPDPLDNDSLVVHFIGRSDQQVKVSGIRLDLTEIEGSLLRHPAIQRASVVAECEEQADEKHLVAYIVLNQNVNVADLQRYMKQQLPSYMVPSKFVSVDDILLDDNGKVHKTKLQTMEGTSIFQIMYSSSQRKPVNEEERSMAKIWSCVLHLPEEKIMMDTNFFENGGHSLSAQRMVSIVSTNLSVDIKMAAIYNHPVFEDFVESVSFLTENDTEGQILTECNGSISFQQHVFAQLENIGRYSPIFNVFAALLLSEEVDVQAFETALNKVVQKHQILHSLFHDKNGTTEVIESPLLCRVKVSAVTLMKEASTEDAYPLIEEYIGATFDYNRGPLIRCRLYIFGNMTIVVIVFHHIIADDISAWLVMQQILAHYCTDNKMQDENPEAYQLYIAKQKAREGMTMYSEDRQYWEAKLAKLTPLPDFELHGDGIPLGNNRGSVPVSIPASSVRQICKQQNTSPVEVILAAFYLAIYNKTKSNDVFFTSPFACRDDRTSSSLIGPTAQRVVLHLSMPLADIHKPKVVLKLVRHEVAKTLLHQDYPLNVKYPLVGFSFVSLTSEALLRKGLPLMIPYSTMPDDMLMFLDMKDTSNEIKGFLHYDQGYLQYSYMLDLENNLQESITFLSGGECEHSTLANPIQLEDDMIPSNRPLSRVFYNCSIVDLWGIKDRICADNSVRDCYVTVTQESSHPKFYIYVQADHSRNITDDHIMRLAQKIKLEDATITQVLSLPRDEQGYVDEGKVREILVLDSTLLTHLQTLALNCYPDAGISVQKNRAHKSKAIESSGSTVASKTELPVSSMTDKEFTKPKEDTLNVQLPQLTTLEEMPKTMVAALQKTASKYPTKGITFIEEKTDPKFMSYATLYQSALQYQSAIMSHGLKKGSFVILLISKPRKLIPFWWGCVLGGIVPTIVAKSSSYKELSGTTEKLYHVWKTLDRATVFTDTDPESIKEMQKFHSEFQGAQVFSLATMSGRHSADDTPATPEEPSPCDLLFLQLSSGSTGAPKCIQELHSMILSHIVSSVEANGYSSDDRSLNWISMDHVVPILTFHLKDTLLGCSQHMVDTSIVISDPLNWMKLMTEYKITHTWSPNFGYAKAAEALVRASKEDKHGIDLSTLKCLINAGEMVIPRTIHSFLQAATPFGLTETAVQPLFGMAETSTCITTNNNTVSQGSSSWTKKHKRSEFVNLGSPIRGVDIRVVDESGHELSEGEIGELQIRGDVVTPGYLYNEKANKLLFRDGWMCSGDNAFIINGDLFVTGRIKEQIVIMGNKYFCHEIEERINEVRGVEPLYCAACGVENKNTGTEELLIFFCPSDPDLHKQKQLDDTIRKIHVTVNKHFDILPTHVVALTEHQFEKTTSGKIQRVAMKTKYKEGKYTRTVISNKKHYATVSDVPTHTLAWKPVALCHCTTVGNKMCVIFNMAGSKLSDLIQIEMSAKHCTVLTVSHTDKNLQLREPNSTLIHTISQKASRESYAEMFRKLKEICGFADIIINTISYDHPSEESNSDSPWLDEQNQQLLFLLQGLEAFPNESVKVINVTSHSAFVTDSDVVQLSRSFSSPLIEVANKEFKHCHVMLVDLPGNEVIGSSELDKLSGVVVEEALAFHKETQVAYRNLQRYIPQLNKISLLESTDECYESVKLIERGLYIISGGIGGIGRRLAHYLHDRLNAKLILVGRTPTTDPKVQRRLEVLHKHGIDFTYVKGDISIKKTLENVLSACGSHTVCGAFHLAATYEEKTIKELSLESLDATMRAKVKGAVLLHDFLQHNSPNAVLILFSSIYSIFAMKGLASYSAANRFLEMFQHHCRNDFNISSGAACNVQTVCINWPIWKNTGMSYEHGINQFAESLGVITLDPATALHYIEPLLSLKIPVYVGFKNDCQLVTQHTSYERACEMGICLDQCIITITTEASVSNEYNKRALIDKLEGEKLRDVFGNCLDLSKVHIQFSNSDVANSHVDADVSKCIEKHWKQVLELTEDKDLPSENFYELGGKSLHIMALVLRLSEAFNLILTTSDILEHPTVPALSAAISALMSGEKPHQDIWHPTRGSKQNGEIDVFLFCLPYIGAQPQLFQDWSYSGVSIWTAVYPQQSCSMQDLVDMLAVGISEIAKKKTVQFVLFGYSFGALLAVEICHYLSSQQMTTPAVLIVCSMYSPMNVQVKWAHHQKVSDAPNDYNFLIQLKEKFGFDTEPDMLMYEEFKPTIDQLRFLCEMFEHYKCTPGLKVDCPIEVMGGKNDDLVKPSDLKEWCECTSNDVRVTPFDGGNLFIMEHSREVFAQVVAILNSVVYRKKLLQH